MLEFFSWKKFECGKNLRVSLFPYPKEAPECPLYGPEKFFSRGLLHLGHTLGHSFYLHLEHTFRITFRNYISTYIRIISIPRPRFCPHLHPLELHQTTPFTYLPIVRLLRHTKFHSQAFYHIIITFRTYIRITFIFHQITYLALTFLFTL